MQDKVTLALKMKLAALITLIACTVTSSVSAQDPPEFQFEYQTPALVIDDDGFWTLDSKGFRSADRFFRNKNFGTKFDDPLIVDRNGFGVGFESTEGPDMRAVRRDYQLIGQYMLLARIDRETTRMIGRKHGLELDWDDDCILGTWGDMTARSCFESVTITWPDDTIGFMLKEEWVDFVRTLCQGGNYVRTDGSCPSSSGPFAVVLKPNTMARSFRSIEFSSRDGTSKLVLFHNIRPAEVQPRNLFIIRRNEQGEWHDLSLEEKRKIIESARDE
ncbi:MAG: hypothetical protein AAF340_12530 [Pseudomonadota bacterium]